MNDHHQEIAELDKQASEHELVAQRTPNFSMWLKNELRAAELRRRIEVLRQHPPLRVHPER